MEFGTHLKTSRTNKGISQEQLAKVAGVHPNHISRYERGLSSPSIEVAAKIAEALEVSLDKLVFGLQANPEEAISDRELIALFKKVQHLSSTQQATVKDFLQAFVFKAGVQEQLASS